MNSDLYFYLGSCLIFGPPILFVAFIVIAVLRTTVSNEPQIIMKNDVAPKESRARLDAGAMLIVLGVFIWIVGTFGIVMGGAIGDNVQTNTNIIGDLIMVLIISSALIIPGVFVCKNGRRSQR
ncbi:MAG: hypothetical protein WAW90_02680 [Minisyncoccia bacterium]